MSVLWIYYCFAFIKCKASPHATTTWLIVKPRCVFLTTLAEDVFFFFKDSRRSSSECNDGTRKKQIYYFFVCRHQLGTEVSVLVTTLLCSFLYIFRDARYILLTTISDD